MTSEAIGLLQGTEEWHAHRARHFNASEAGAVMGVNPWFPKTPADLFDLKKGVKDVKFNSNMQWGIDNEPRARTYAEAMMSETFTPAVYTNGRYSASLDGVNFDGTVAIEVKCPVSESSPLFELSTPRLVLAEAPHYWWQIVHQFYCLPTLKHLGFVIYHPVRQNVIMFSRFEAEPYFEALENAWKTFAEAFDADQRPQEEDLDDSEEFQKLVHAYRVEKLKLEAQEKHLKAVEEELKGYAKRTGKSTLKGFGATVTQVTRQGSVDYKKIPELKGVDLDAYRGKATTYWMVKL